MLSPENPIASPYDPIVSLNNPVYQRNKPKPPNMRFSWEAAASGSVLQGPKYLSRVKGLGFIGRIEEKMENYCSILGLYGNNGKEWKRKWKLL